MKKNTLIFCEGITDQVFIADCIEIFYNIRINRSEEKKLVTINKKGEEVKEIQVKMSLPDGGEIIAVGGCGNLGKPLFTDKIQDNSAYQGVSLVIFDADSDGLGNNGFDNAQKSLRALQKKVPFHFHLWPNHQDNGTIENLIRQIVHEEKESVMKCIDAYQECLANTGVEGLRRADDKDIIRYYLHTNMVDKTEGRYVDYKDTSLWNIDAPSIPDLKKFKNFLDNYF